MPEPPFKLGTHHRAGPHRMTVEGPDLLHLRVDGDVDVEHIKAFIELVESMPAEVHILRDARKSRIVTTRAREYMMKHMPKGKVWSFISFGAPFHAQTMITMLGRAIRLLHKNSPVVGFTKTEAEARAWIDKVRVERRRSG